MLLTAAHELTHYLRENNAEGYAQLRDFVMQHLTEDGVDIEKLAEQKVARENGLLPMDEAVEEVIADSCEMMLRDTRLPEIMAKEKPGLYEQIREWIANFAEKLRKAFAGIEARHEEARAMMQYAEEMQQIWDNALAGAVRNTEAATENGTAAPNNGTKNARRENQQLEEHEVVTALYDALDHADAGHDNVIKVGRMPQFVRELTGIDGDFYIYRNHMYSNIKTEKEAKAEGRYKKGEHYHGVGMERMTDAIMAIENPVLTMNDTKKNGTPEITMVLPVMGASGTPLYAALGFYAPQSIKGSMAQRPHIILSIYERLEGMSPEGREYKGLTAVIDEAAKGKKVLSYDKTKRDILPLTAQLSTLGSITDTSLKENIAQFQKEVNNFKQKNKINYSMRERDEDLQKKYPRLNLNEDISELDGVPAIELTDGSILPIKDRDRYRTHVSFIEGNRIDVDDLRSGGWIGNGVYDASFTSDTARYIEQQQAKKRVAELRGVPYDQFENGNTRYSMRERDDRQAAIQRELNQLKGEKKDLLNANAEYAAAVEQRRYAETFTERVAASKALKAAEAKVDTAEIDARIEMLQNESEELREQERAEYNAAKEKYSGAKTKGYSQYADTRTRELDEEYSRAVTARDETKMQELVLEAAERAMPNSVIRDENGKLKPVYHYTNNDFTVFDRSRARTGNEMDGFFFAPDPESTTEYGERRVTAFLNITNPAYDPYLDRKYSDSGTLLREKLAYEGYDGVIRTEDGKAYEYMAFDPEQIKSAETITYDDAGNVIPLSERFNSRSNDIRYSMRDVAEDDTADERRGRQESYAELRRQNEELKRRVEYFRGQTRTTKEATVRKADTDAFARRLTEELHNKDAADTVKEELKRMGDYIVQTDGRELSYAELKDWAAAIADHILSGSEAEIESWMEDARRELLDYLKANKLKVNEREMLDLPEGWKRQHRRIRFSKDGLPIDTAWMELQEKFGEGMFPNDITAQADRLEHIADIERAWQPVRGNPFENYMGEMRETVAQDIPDTMLSDEIRQTAKTAADRARDRMNNAVAEERTRYNDMKSRMQERIQQVYQEGVARKQEAVAKRPCVGVELLPRIY